MPALTFILPDATQRTLEADPGANLMRTARAADIPGIVAECGGAAMCATCHVYVDDASAGLFAPIGEVEDEMLECAADGRRPSSRLSCQLVMPAQDVVLHVPATQT